MGIDVARRHQPLIIPRYQQQGHRSGKKRNNSYCNRFSVTVAVTVTVGNLGSCDKNPGKADTKDETGAIVGKSGGNMKEGCVDPRGAGAKRGRGIDKGGSRPAAEKK
jgi:hypothetical protein